MGNEWLTKGDYKALDAFQRSLERLAKNKGVVRRLKIANKTRGLLAEIYAVQILHKKFESRSIRWHGGGTKGFDLQIDNSKVQVKKITGTYGNGKFYWNWKESALEKHAKGKNPKIISPWAVERLRSKFDYPYIFIEYEGLKPVFICYSKSEMLRMYEKTIVGHNKWIKKQWKKKHRQMNLNTPRFNINSKGHKNRFGKVL